MKNKLLFLLTVILSSATCFSQVTTKIQADTVRIFQVPPYPAELILENATRTRTNAFLQNWGNGRTRFTYALDSVWATPGYLNFRRGTSTMPFAIRDGIDSVHVTNDSLYEYKDGIPIFKGLITGTVGTGKLNISDTASMLSPYLRKVDTTNKWISRVNASITGALNVTSPITPPGGSLNFTWQGTNAQYVRGDGSLATFSSSITSITNPLYALASHGHLHTDITDFTTAVRNLFSQGTGISYNASTGVIAWDGSGTGISNLNGLTSGTQTLAIDTTGSSASWSSVGTAHTLRLPARLFSPSFDTSTIYANLASKVPTSRTITINGITFDLSANRSWTVSTGSGTVNNSANANRIAYYNASGTAVSPLAAITANRALTSDGNGLPVASTTTDTQIGYLSTLTSNVQTQINAKEATFTETTQEFTGSTSTSITLTNTPKTGKAEMYYYNGVVMKVANISRTGTSVTLTLPFARETTDVITAKYSY
jgi:hypothetical protein